MEQLEASLQGRLSGMEDGLKELSNTSLVGFISSIFDNDPVFTLDPSLFCSLGCTLPFG